jgi:GABA(A) receptor-associated protein
MSERLLLKYPDRIPIIVSGKPSIDKNKYLVPDSITFGEFISIVRKRIKINSHQALFAFINNALPPVGMNIRDLYNECKSEDGFLYVKYQFENTFG